MMRVFSLVLLYGFEQGHEGDITGGKQDPEAMSTKAWSICASGTGVGDRGLRERRAGENGTRQG